MNTLDDARLARTSSSTKVLHQYAHHSCVPVRLAVAGNPHATHAVLVDLLEDSSVAVRFTAGLRLLEELTPDAETLEIAALLWDEGWNGGWGPSRQVLTQLDELVKMAQRLK